jgi:formylglycine-generating enzyme required for sulfatase activity
MIAAVSLLVALLVSLAGAAEPPRTIRDCADCPTLVVIPAGKFTMGNAGGNALGAADESEPETGETLPLAVVLVRPFALGKLEVTRGDFARFVKATGYAPAAGCRVWRDGWAIDPAASWRKPSQPAKPADDHPVNCVGWDDAVAYAAWLAKITGKPYRLPSESEWEYAARAGSTAARPFGNNSFEGVSISLACDNANVFDVTAQAVYLFSVPYARCRDGYADVAPVGRFAANAFGIHDMIGNVAEWLADCYTASYWGRPPDGRAWVWKGGCETRVVRGGSWASRPSDARSAKRFDAAPDARASTIGFRIARDLTPEDQ